MQAALSVQAAIAPVPAAWPADKARKATSFSAFEGGGGPGADGTDPPNLTQPAR